MKALLHFNLSAKKNPLPCVVETSGHRMHCIFWPVMSRLKRVCIFDQLNYYAYNRKTPTDRCH